MNNEFTTIAILGRDEDSRVTEPMALLAAFLSDNGCDVIVAPGSSLATPVREVAEDSIAAEADLIVAVGGDGTMLYAASIAQQQPVPLLGVNRGRLGFLTDVKPTEMLQSLEYVLGGDYARETRLLLTARIVHPNGETQSAVALNDVVLQRTDTGRLLDFRTCIAGRYVNTHSGDGLIVATPTGSTAYSLSCGGPIMEPALDAVVIVPICPHTLSDRPIVIPADQEIEVTLLEHADTIAEVAVDGQTIGEVGVDERLLISRADARITLLHPPGYDYYETLRSKLHWGLDSRLRDSQPDVAGSR
jgi:NAD+ kinase